MRSTALERAGALLECSTAHVTGALSSTRRVHNLSHSNSPAKLPGMLRIPNGEIRYWPNLGYGLFGAKVIMD